MRERQGSRPATIAPWWVVTPHRACNAEISSDINGRRGCNAQRGCRSRRQAIAGSQAAAGGTEVPDIRWPAATVELPAVRMDNRWQAMDSGAVPTRSVSEHPLSLHRRPAATRRRRPWHRTTAHHALSFQRGNAVRMPAPGRRLKIGSPAIGRARYSLPSGAAKPGAIPPRPPACRGGGLGAGTPKTGPARTRRSHAVTHRAILQDRQSKGTPTRSGPAPNILGHRLNRRGKTREHLYELWAPPIRRGQLLPLLG